MNIINISTDKKIFDPASTVRARMLDQAKLFTTLHIVIFTKKNSAKNKNLEYKDEHIGNNLWIHPTNSRSKIFYIQDAIAITKKLIQDQKHTSNNTVISTQDPFETGVVGVRVKKLLKFPLQIQIHTDFLSPYFTKNSFLNTIRVFLAKKNLSYADEIRVVSKRIKNSLANLNIKPEKIDILPVYTDISIYQPDIAQENLAREKEKVEAVKNIRKKYTQFDFLILMASRLTQEKNVNFALTIFRDIINKFPKTGLVIIGEGSQKKKLEEKAKKLNIQSNVIFEPWQQNLVPYYQTCDIFLSTSLYEGYGLTLIEAGLFGACIVTSDVGIAREIIPDETFGFVCPVNDKKCFIEKISSLIEDPAKLEECGTKIAGLLAQSDLLIHDKVEYLKKYRELLEKTLQSSQK